MKRVIALALVAGSASIGFIAAPVAASAADCADGTVVQAHLHANLNGTPVDQDICLPPAG